MVLDYLVAQLLDIRQRLTGQCGCTGYAAEQFSVLAHGVKRGVSVDLLY
jgi:hypothetical protein